MSLPKVFEDMDAQKAYVQHALFILAELRSTIIDGLTSPGDLYLKTTLLQDADSVRDALERAL